MPYQLRRMHVAVLVGGVSVTVSTGVVADGGRLGGEVMVCCDVVVPLIMVDVLSLHPQNRPGVKQVVLMLLVEVALVSVDFEVVVIDVVVVTLSLQPNHPGVRQVVVEVVVTSVDVCVPVVVVVSSRHPHHPLLQVSRRTCVLGRADTYGVLHVSVRVRVLVDVGEDVEDVVVSVPLLSYIFHGPQSRHSGVNLHSGTVSYFMITSWITDRILCVPIPTRQPLSPTVSYTHSIPVWQADSRA